MYSRILVPVDGSTPSSLGLQEAIKLAKALHASIRLIHVIDCRSLASTMSDGSEYVQILEGQRVAGNELLYAAQARVSHEGIEVDSFLVEATAEPIGSCVVGKAREWHADLIVCGTHGRRGVERLLMGSDAEYILRHSPVPVLLVRAPRQPAEKQHAA